MKKNKIIKFYKRIVAVFLVVLMNINSYAAVSANDGSAFVTKAEFDALVNTFNEQMDNYEKGISTKIDGSIANYLAGLSSERTISITLPGYTWMKSYGENANIIELGIDTTDTRDSKDGNSMYKQGILYTYYPKYYFSGILTVCVGYSSSAKYQQEVYVGHMIDGAAYRGHNGDNLIAAAGGRNKGTDVTADKLISINPNIYFSEGGKDYVNKVYKALQVNDNESILGTNPTGGRYVYGGWIRGLKSSPISTYDLYASSDSGVVSASNFSGYRYQALLMGTDGEGATMPSGAYSVGPIITDRSNVIGVCYNNWLDTSSLLKYQRAVTYTEEKNEIVPRFKELADATANVDTNKIMSVINKKDNYNNKKYFINKKTNVATLCNILWCAVGNTSLNEQNASSSLLPLRAGVAYNVYAYEANTTRKKATELYDYFLKDKYDIDSNFTDRVFVYKNEENTKGKLKFYIVPTSSFILTLSKKQKYEGTDTTNLYTFNYSGGTGSSSGSTNKLTVVHTAYDEGNPLQLEVVVENKECVWLGGESINNGYITFKFLKDASLFVED